MATVKTNEEIECAKQAGRNRPFKHDLRYLVVMAEIMNEIYLIVYWLSKKSVRTFEHRQHSTALSDSNSCQRPKYRSIFVVSLAVLAEP